MLLFSGTQEYDMPFCVVGIINGHAGEFMPDFINNPAINTCVDTFPLFNIR